MIFFLIVFICGELFQPTCPTVGDGCGLAGQEKPVTIRKRIINYKNFRRGDIDPKYPWKILDPGKLRKLVPTSSTARIYWNLTKERCDYLRIRCMEAYLTGAICARTIYYQYMSFDSYCVMNWHNCIYRYDNIWSIAYMGYCVDVDMDKGLYVDMSYEAMANNTKLKMMYVAGSADQTDFKGYATAASTKPTSPRSRAALPTLQTIYFNVTDKNGSVVTDKNNKTVTGSYILTTTTTTIPHINVTDSEGHAMTDDYGDYITITEPTPTVKTPPTTHGGGNETTTGGPHVTTGGPHATIG